MQAEIASRKVTNWVVATLVEGSRHLSPITVGTAIVTPQDLTKIAQLIDNGKVKVGLVSKATQKEMKATAAYLRSNTILIPDRINRNDLPELGAVCVHEATHAVNDLNRLRDTKVVDEAAAHIAEAMYMLEKGISIPQSRLYVEACNCARLFKKGKRPSEGALRLFFREIRLAYKISAMNASEPLTAYDGI